MSQQPPNYSNPQPPPQGSWQSPPHAGPGGPQHWQPYQRPPSSGNGAVIAVLLILAIPGFIGIMAVMSVFGVRRYIANAKQAEARNAVGQLSMLATAAFERDGSLCPSAAAPVPAVVPHATKYQSSPADWQSGEDTKSGFGCLKFSMMAPQYYQYDYKATATGFTVTAHGDLDGDGVESTFEMQGRVDNGRLVVSPVIAETNPDE